MSFYATKAYGNFYAEFTTNVFLNPKTPLDKQIENMDCISGVVGRIQQAFKEQSVGLSPSALRNLYEEMLEKIEIQEKNLAEIEGKLNPHNLQQKKKFELITKQIQECRESLAAIFKEKLDHSQQHLKEKIKGIAISALTDWGQLQTAREL